jgi:hypothetical protein
MLFLYQSDKIMNISLETELERTTNESNMTKIKEYMDFCLLIREENQEINEENCCCNRGHRLYHQRPSRQAGKWRTSYATSLRLGLRW